MSNVKAVLGTTLGALLVGLFAAGCGDNKPVARQLTGKEKLEEVGQMLKSLANEKQSPPAKPADLANVEPLIPMSAEDIRSGAIVYSWGTGISSGGAAASTVIAYEKKAATDGGYVLLQDGTVKQMSAAEFQAAPKAKK